MLQPPQQCRATSETKANSSLFDRRQSHGGSFGGGRGGCVGGLRGFGPLRLLLLVLLACLAAPFVGFLAGPLVFDLVSGWLAVFVSVCWFGGECGLDGQGNKKENKTSTQTEEAGEEQTTEVGVKFVRGNLEMAGRGCVFKIHFQNFKKPPPAQHNTPRQQTNKQRINTIRHIDRMSFQARKVLPENKRTPRHTHTHPLGSQLRLSLSASQPTAAPSKHYTQLTLFQALLYCFFVVIRNCL